MTMLMMMTKELRMILFLCHRLHSLWCFFTSSMWKCPGTLGKSKDVAESFSYLLSWTHFDLAPSYVFVCDVFPTKSKVVTESCPFPFILIFFDVMFSTWVTCFLFEMLLHLCCAETPRNSFKKKIVTNSYSYPFSWIHFYHALSSIVTCDVFSTFSCDNTQALPFSIA